MNGIIEEIQNYNFQLLRELEELPVRNFASSVDWSERMIGITGAKGVGKTTLLLQRLQNLHQTNKSVLYLSLDHPSFSQMPLIKLAEEFNRLGGEVLLLDEVHKYSDWSAHIKSIFDTFKKIQVVFSGSSALHINAGKGDLSRRARMYKCPILSFREFLQLELGSSYERIEFPTLLKEHVEISKNILISLKPYKHLKAYLEYGAYPFYRENRSGILQKLLNVINHTLEGDLVFIHGLDPRYSSKLRMMLSMISESVPFVPNITDIAQAVGLSRPTVSQYLEYLQDGGLIHLVMAQGKGYQKLAKPEKIYLDNTNLSHALTNSNPNIGTIRETFIMSNLKLISDLVEIPNKADFIVNGKFVFEVGGKNKTREQIKNVENSYLIVDDVEVGSGNKIPLWLFGFLF